MNSDIEVIKRLENFVSCLPTFTDEFGIKTYVDYNELRDLITRFKAKVADEHRTTNS